MLRSTRIGVDFDAAVVEEAHEPVPLVEAVADDLGDRSRLR
jgi:hypothetical protein